MRKFGIRSAVLAFVIDILVMAQCHGVASAQARSQQPLRSYPLSTALCVSDGCESADISSDERTLALSTREWVRVRNVKWMCQERALQLWDFRAARLIAEHPLTPAPTCGGRWFSVRSIVRYVPSTGAVAIYDGWQAVHLFHPPSTTEYQTIDLQLAGDLSDSESHVMSMEAAPNEPWIAILVWDENAGAELRIYDAESGQLLKHTAVSITVIRGEPAWGPSSVTWRTDGKYIAIAAARSLPCDRPGNAPDIFIYDPVTLDLVRKFRSGLLTDAIAFTADNRIFAADVGCVGIFVNRAPKLRILDESTGRSLADVDGRGTGVRWYLSASSDGRRLVGYVGRSRGWLDIRDPAETQTREKIIDQEFRVWDLPSMREVVSSQNVKGLRGCHLRISPKGHFVFCDGTNSYPASASGPYTIYEIP